LKKEEGRRKKEEGRRKMKSLTATFSSQGGGGKS